MVFLLTQNRNKLIGLFIGNLTNGVLHDILEQAITQEEIARKYHKELLTSLALARKYRNKITPLHSPLPVKDVVYIKNKTIQKITSELRQRIARGYTGIDVKITEALVEKALKEMKVIA